MVLGGRVHPNSGPLLLSAPARRADAPVFLVAAPRSGTTWLQLLLSQHPAVATSQETHLFSAYLSPFLARWDYEVEPDVTRRRVGLSTLMTEPEFVAMCRGMADDVLARILCGKPGASVAIEKSPNHVMEWRKIRRVIPDARFIVLHRDPRAVASSLIAASATWASGWAPNNALDAARYWRMHLLAGQELIRECPDATTIRYEDLELNGPRTLSALFGWLGLPVGEVECAPYFKAVPGGDTARKHPSATMGPTPAVADAPGGDALPEVPWDLATEPEGFYRAATRQGWEAELSAADIRRIEQVTGDLMDELGYARRGPAGQRVDLAVRWRDTVSRLLDRVDWRVRRWLRGL